jgi:alkylated DNA repair dioxygenase AlkB
MELNTGDLVGMLGMTQKYWQHQIPKQKDVGYRISETFRLLSVKEDD